ncbi:spore cortex biosynthesis protein YabQ [Oceanobacillus manasiensis]|uniref:spore cortex biosynthesis protein YabQ n=1 Tax=Oceanobacillus manasiensis TaxID=586413 RepID=UPI0005A93296|nr:spore cortex biosynthesis protein YabQ [Oceanobacillus manasiensis]
MTLSTQFLTMLAMVSSGFYLGIVQDTFRRFTPYWKKKVVLTYTMEVSFWLTQTLIVFYVLFQVNGGELRFYVFVACLLGFAAYQALAAESYKKLLEHIIRILTAVYRFLERCVKALFITPIKWIFDLIWTVFFHFLKLLVTVLLFLLTIIITPFGWIFRFIYRLLPDGFKNFFRKIAGFYSKMKNIGIKLMKRLKRR